MQRHKLMFPSRTKVTSSQIPQRKLSFDPCRKPQLPYDIVYSILADVLGQNIYQFMTKINPERTEDDLQYFDAIASLQTVSRMFRDIVLKILNSAFSPSLSPQSSYVYAPS